MVRAPTREPAVRAPTREPAARAPSREPVVRAPTREPVVCGVVDHEGKSTIRRDIDDDLINILTIHQQQQTAATTTVSATAAKKFVQQSAPPVAVETAFVNNDATAFDLLTESVPQQSGPLPQRFAATTPSGWEHVGRPARRMAIQGLRRILRTVPPKNTVKPYHLDAECQHELDQQMAEMQRLGVVEPAQPHDVHSMHAVFAVKQQVDGANSKYRIIADLRSLNTYAKRRKFQMTGLKEVRHNVTKGSWLAKVDVSKAYWHVPLAEDLRRFFVFPLLQPNGKLLLYRWCCMPFGFSLAPFLYSLLTKSALQMLRKHYQICVIDYIDDFLVVGRTRMHCLNSWLTLIYYLGRLGFTISFHKCSPPSQITKFLGVLIDSTTMRFSIPVSRVINTRKTIRRILRDAAISPRRLASLIGDINWLAATAPYLRSFLVTPIKWKTSRLKACPDWDRWYPIDNALSKALNCIHIYLQDCELASAIKCDLNECVFVIDVDASDLGYGAQIRGASDEVLAEMAGSWPDAERVEHINWKETCAIVYAVDNFLPFISDCQILIRSDNITVVSCCRKLYNLVSNKLNALSNKLRNLFYEHSITCFSTHLSGIHNTKADFLSRLRYDNQDWTLHRDVFSKLRKLCAMIGVVLTLDMFSTHRNRQLARFVSRYYDKNAEFCDAFSQTWGNMPPFLMNPPFVLFSQALTKFLVDGASVALAIVPVWPTKPWWSSLQQLSCVGLLLPRIPRLFTPVSNVTQPHPRWRTAAVLISANAQTRQKLRTHAIKAWPRTSTTLAYSPEHRNSTIQSYNISHVGVPRMDMSLGIPLLPFRW